MKTKSEAGLASPIWAITSYFNPAGYRRRLFNYRQFHRALEVPLIAVEWSLDGKYDLEEGDAEILIQISTGDTLWQKEKLLNIAWDHLPKVCRYVAWLDCDLIFGHEGWSEAACHLLENYPLIQLFDEAIHLPVLPFDDFPDLKHFPLENAIFRESCLVKQYLKGEAVLASPSRSRLALANDSSSRGTTGMAWAARRDLLESSPLYDTCIVGGGDSALALAAFGESDSAIIRLNMTPPHRDHYKEWAATFYEAVRGEVGYLPHPVYHLWHGNLADRQYEERHDILQQFSFNPHTHLLHSSRGGWQWDNAPEQLRSSINDYFKLRREDDVLKFPVTT